MNSLCFKGHTSLIDARMNSPTKNPFVILHSRLIGSIVPAFSIHDPQEYRRARVLSGFLVYASLFSALMQITRFSTDNLAGPLFASSLIPVGFVTLIIAYRTSRNVNVCADLTILMTLWAVIQTAYFDGGLTSRAHNWLPAVTLMASFIGFRIKAFSTLLYASISLVFLLVSHKQGMILTPDHASPLVAYIITSVASMLFVAIIASAYESTRKEATDAILGAKEKAEDAVRQKSLFLNTMSHELRTPMNGVIGMLQLLLRSTLDKRQLKQAQAAAHSADSMLNLIKSILDYVKLDSGQYQSTKQNFNLAELMQELANKTRASCEQKQLTFKYSSHFHSDLQFGDYHALKQILTTLLDNAQKFTNEGEIRLDCSEKDTLITIRVSDTGQGIAADKQVNIFEPFTQIDASSSRAFEGTGLGLALAKRYCLHLDAELTIISQLDKGSQFQLQLQMQAEGK
ncbi:MAG: signal transduction histidine kinase [Flavobacteriales bacterium]|jgi:signal transduction histidine kinase